MGADAPWTPEPWLPYLATEYIFEKIKPELIFEWGSGGSTIAFTNAERANRIVTVESDGDWHDRVLTELRHRGILFRVNLVHIPWEAGEIGPDKSDPAHYKSGSTELGPVNFKAYASYIDQYSPFDLVLVDGFARASCLAHAAPKVKPGGWLVLDNTDRDYYLARTAPLFEGWERVDFYGYGPILAYPWKCTMFRRPS